MKRILAILLTLTMVFALCACGHTHKWVEATCTEPKTCSKCGETEGKALGHKWIPATFTEPETCSVCGETSGDPLDMSDKTIENLISKCVESKVETEKIGYDFAFYPSTRIEIFNITPETDSNSNPSGWKAYGVYQISNYQRDTRQQGEFDVFVYYDDPNNPYCVLGQPYPIY